MSLTIVDVKSLKIKVTLKTVLLFGNAQYYFDAKSLQEINNALYYFSRHPEDWDSNCNQSIELHYKSPAGKAEPFTMGTVLHALGVVTNFKVVNTKKTKGAKERSQITWMGLNTLH